MQEVVDDFNASQDRIRVEYSSVSQINRKLMLAIGGGNPPDVAGLFGNTLAVYAENNALTPLDKLAAENKVTKGDYIDVFWEICNHRGHLWGLPSAPASLALVWNKKLFREAGLDPERPPQSIAELEEYNEKLARRDGNGRLVAAGLLPSEPGWWPAIWGWWFGGDLWDGQRITANSPENLAAMDWIASYPERFGARDLLSFRDGFGNFASPQNAFFTGRVAMVLQGPWIQNFIRDFAPDDFEWGAAAFPSSDPAKSGEVTLVETHVLVIPAGAKHPREGIERRRLVADRWERAAAARVLPARHARDERRRRIAAVGCAREQAIAERRVALDASAREREAVDDAAAHYHRTARPQSARRQHPSGSYAPRPPPERSAPQAPPPPQQQQQRPPSRSVSPRHVAPGGPRDPSPRDPRPEAASRRGADFRSRKYATTGQPRMVGLIAQK
jgi:hypothetical protein